MLGGRIPRDNGQDQIVRSRNYCCSSFKVASMDENKTQPSKDYHDLHSSFMQLNKKMGFRLIKLINTKKRDSLALDLLRKKKLLKINISINKTRFLSFQILKINLLNVFSGVAFVTVENKETQVSWQTVGQKEKNR